MAVEQVMEVQTQQTPSDDPSTTALFAKGLPALTTPVPRDAVLKRLDAAARRGKMAGFATRGTPDIFEVEAFSEPFDHALVAQGEPAGDGLRLTFRMEMLKKKLLIFALIIVVSIWPGLPLTHSMLVTYFSWYQWSVWVTAAWYLPLTVFPLVWLIPRWLRKSKAEAAAAAQDQVLKLRDLLDGTLTQG